MKKQKQRESEFSGARRKLETWVGLGSEEGVGKAFFLLSHGPEQHLKFVSKQKKLPSYVGGVVSQNSSGVRPFQKDSNHWAPAKSLWLCL